MRKLKLAKAALTLGIDDSVGRILARLAELEGDAEERAEGDSPQEIVVGNVHERLASILKDMGRIQERLGQYLDEGKASDFIEEAGAMRVLAQSVVTLMEDVETLAEQEAPPMFGG